MQCVFLYKFLSMLALSNAQIEIVNLFRSNLKDDELAEFKRLLIDFKAKLLQKLLDEKWNSGELSDEILEQWSKEHNRTPYKSQNEFLAKQAK